MGSEMCIRDSNGYAAKRHVIADNISESAIEGFEDVLVMHRCCTTQSRQAIVYEYANLYQFGRHARTFIVYYDRGIAEKIGELRLCRYFTHRIAIQASKRYFEA